MNRLNRLVLPLVVLTVVMQATILYRQYRPPTLTGQPPSAKELVVDAAKDSIMDLDGLPTKGNNGNLVLVEFSDYECPFCARHANGVAQQLEQKYISTGRIRYAFANNPLPIHQNAKFLASAAICAGKQGRYWGMHDRLFSAQPKSKDQVQ